MKSFAVLAFAGAVVAQSLTDLPPCGQTCISNMLAIAQQDFGCSVGDAVCYCTNANFGYGVRDCSNEACSASDAANVIVFGTSYCAAALASASVGVTTGALPILTSALGTATESISITATGTGGGAQSTAITTEALVATATDSAGSTFVTTTGFSTVYSSIEGAASSAASSLSGSLASVASSVSSSLASEASSVGASVSSLLSSAHASGSAALSSGAAAASSALNSATGGGAPSSTGGAAPMMTGLPFAGAAGMAAWLLL